MYDNIHYKLKKKKIIKKKKNNNDGLQVHLDPSGLCFNKKLYPLGFGFLRE